MLNKDSSHFEAVPHVSALAKFHLWIYDAQHLILHDNGYLKLF